MSSQGASGAQYSCTFTITAPSTANNGLGYTYVIINPGRYFIIGNRIVIPGTSFDGLSPTNDLTLTVASIGISGQILTFTVTGTPITPRSADKLFGVFTFISSGTQGYRSTMLDIRDASDWITLKKQVILASNKKLLAPNGPKGESYGNNYRMDVKQGVFKEIMLGCTGCFGGAFNGN